MYCIVAERAKNYGEHGVFCSHSMKTKGKVVHGGQPDHICLLPGQIEEYLFVGFAPMVIPCEGLVDQPSDPHAYQLCTPPSMANDVSQEVDPSGTLSAEVFLRKCTSCARMVYVILGLHCLLSQVPSLAELDVI